MVDNASFSDGGGDGSQVVHVTTAHLIATALPLLLVAAVGHHFDLGIENGLTVGIARSFVQLMVLGMILQPIFVLGTDMSWVVFLCKFNIFVVCCTSTLYSHNTIVPSITQMSSQ